VQSIQGESSELRDISTSNRVEIPPLVATAVEVQVKGPPTDSASRGYIDVPKPCLLGIGCKCPYVWDGRSDNYWG
jgi:hypothetical protein